MFSRFLKIPQNSLIWGFSGNFLFFFFLIGKLVNNHAFLLEGNLLLFFNWNSHSFCHLTLTIICLIFALIEQHILGEILKVHSNRGGSCPILSYFLYNISYIFLPCIICFCIFLLSEHNMRKLPNIEIIQRSKVTYLKLASWIQPVEKALVLISNPKKVD